MSQHYLQSGPRNENYLSPWNSVKQREDAGQMAASFFARLSVRLTLSPQRSSSPGSNPFWENELDHKPLFIRCVLSKKVFNSKSQFLENDGNGMMYLVEWL